MYHLGYRFCTHCGSWLPSRISWRTARGEVVREVNNCPFCGTRVRANPRRSRSKGRINTGYVMARGYFDDLPAG